MRKNSVVCYEREVSRSIILLICLYPANGLLICCISSLFLLLVLLVKTIWHITMIMMSGKQLFVEWSDEDSPIGRVLAEGWIRESRMKIAKGKPIVRVRTTSLRLRLRVFGDHEWRRWKIIVKAAISCVRTIVRFTYVGLSLMFTHSRTIIYPFLRVNRSINKRRMNENFAVSLLSSVVK